ncbi:hypothetical protein N7535_007499 [Penicillium sp. DV-2018c]|nr:hypothetical protein N7535_007499 [Penicillium sp. DV-2018c]
MTKGKSKIQAKCKRMAKQPKTTCKQVQDDLAERRVTRLDGHVMIQNKHHCPRKRPTHVLTARCIRLGHVVQCPFHPGKFPRHVDECVSCVEGDKRRLRREGGSSKGRVYSCAYKK